MKQLFGSQGQFGRYVGFSTKNTKKTNILTDESRYVRSPMSPRMMQRVDFDGWMLAIRHQNRFVF
ncbi:MAG TPA: hypothetical protein DD670_08710 [Planctomycetaceae bacterium]|nr:hypothetical protein [Planctomycetaceae bacterium]